MKFPQVSSDADVQARYEAMRKRGESHAMAEMCAFRKAPGLNGTDTGFLKGKLLNHGIENNEFGDEMRRKARKAGISIDGKVYNPQMARRGLGVRDPRAWISDTTDIRRYCEQTGAGCSGAVNIKGSEPEPPQQIRLAEDIIQEKMQQYLLKDPSKAANLMELREEIIEKHGSKKDDVNFAPEVPVKPKRIRKVK